MAALPKKVLSCIATYDTTPALCLAHCKVAVYFFSFCLFSRGGKSSGISVLPLEVLQSQLSSAQNRLKYKLQQHEGRGRASRPFATALAAAVDNNT